MSRAANISAKTIDTERLSTHILTAGDGDGVPVLFVHGNLSTSAFWKDTIATLADTHKSVAMDLRGFGDSEPAAIDATRGVRDFSDDLHALITSLGFDSVHLVGWSVGGGVVMQYAIDHADRVESLTLVAPMSPFGFGGTRDASGTPCHEDFAGSGGGTANPEMVQYLRDQERGEPGPTAPRTIMNAFYFKPGFELEQGVEEALLTSMMSARIGDEHYPGNTTTSEHWPGVAPGDLGMNNAISPKYCDLGSFAEIAKRPRVLWIRGADDQIVSDMSMFDFGALGKLGAVPGWPGDDVCPPQPMVAQMRHVLDAYASNGGGYREVVLEDCAHSPHIEQPAAFIAALREHLAG